MMSFTRRKVWLDTTASSVGTSSFSFLIALEHILEGHFTDVNHGLPFAINFSSLAG